MTKNIKKALTANEIIEIQSKRAYKNQLKEIKQIKDLIKEAFKEANVPMDDRHKYLYQILVDKLT